MKQRIITGVLGGVIFLTLVILGGKIFSLFILLLATIGLYEFMRMARIHSHLVAGLASVMLLLAIMLPSLSAGKGFGLSISDSILAVLLILLAFSVFSKNTFHIEHVALSIFGALYIGFGFFYLVMMRESIDGLWLTILVLCGIVSTDSGAYFIGKAIGRHKLWPAISPNKTVEGAIGGLLSAIVVVVVVNALLSQMALGFVIALAVVTAVAAQLGDLIESAIKRHFGFKDSGRILPGHGGVLDRFDSWLIVFPVLHLLGFM